MSWDFDLCYMTLSKQRHGFFVHAMYIVIHNRTKYITLIQKAYSNLVGVYQNITRILKKKKRKEEKKACLTGEKL